jgi:putative Ca2+/H+ antiporter (TMEM165/GDT1 family)
MLEIQFYNLIDAIVYLVAAIIPAYFILKSKNSINNNDNRLRILTIILISFILMQVFYHIVGSLGFRLLAKGFLEPLSMAALLLFGVMFLISTFKAKKQQQQEFKI